MSTLIQKRPMTSKIRSKYLSSKEGESSNAFLNNRKRNTEVHQSFG